MISDVVAAEWLKLRTAPSTRIIVGTLVVLIVLMLGIAWYFVATWDGLSPEMRAHASLGSLVDLTGWIASLVMAVFGTLSISSEFGSGMIWTTFTAMPGRWRVLGAKAVVVAGATFVTAVAALGVVRLGSATIIGERSIGGQLSLDAHGALIVLAMALSMVVFALIGLGLGALTRSGLASVVILSLLWCIVPLLAIHVPPPWGAWLSSLVPGALAGELAGMGNANSVFGAALAPIQALLAMLLYAVVPCVLGGIAIGRRDA